MTGAKVFSTLVPTSGYNLIKKMRLFRRLNLYKGEKLESITMPLGLANAPDIFLLIMDRIVCEISFRVVLSILQIS